LEANEIALVELMKTTDIQLPAEPDLMAEDGAVVNTVQVFVDYLDQRLGHAEVGSILKAALMPPLQAADLTAKPEEGNSLKSRLVSLYALFEENVGRLIKHTGHGNAAGLLARRGLMVGGRRKVGEDDYSEEEGSDTEEATSRYRLVP